MKKLIKLLQNRAGWEKLSYSVPSNANTLAYSLGGITLIGFCILIFTGIFLAQYYSPSLGEANQSVHYLDNQVYLGWFIRGLHYWSMQVVVICVLLHLVRTFLTASFKNPRELNWISGLILLGLTGAFIFTGTVLKWDQEAYEALEHHLWIAKRLGPFGLLLSDEFTDSVSMLGRLYGIHISFLPIILFPVLGLHLFLQKLHGLSKVPLKNNSNSVIPFTDHLKHLIVYGIGLFAVISTLALIVLPPLGDTPVIGVEVTKPPWMFLWIYTLENVWVPSLIYAPAIIFTLLFSVPFFERNSAIALYQRKLPICIFIMFLFVLILLILFGLFSTAGHTM